MPLLLRRDSRQQDKRPDHLGGEKTGQETAELPFAESVEVALEAGPGQVPGKGRACGETDPRPTPPRLVSVLFFCGEVMALDADTGGFNLQAAFSTGFVAGEAAAAFVRSLAEKS